MLNESRSPEKILCDMISEHIDKNSGKLPNSIELFVKVIEMYECGALHGQFGVIPQYKKEFGDIVFGVLAEKSKTPELREKYKKLGEYWSTNYETISEM